MPNKMNYYQLENGLSIYLYPDQTKHSVYANLIVKFGGIYSDFLIDGKPFHLVDGMAHLLEHYTIEQSKYGIIIPKLTERFMQANGYTNRNQTCFYFDAVKYIDEGLELLIKGIHQPVFTKDRLDFTKNSIREEIRADQDSLNSRMDKMKMDQLFKAYSYRSTIGTIEQINNTTIQDVENAFYSFYQPANEIIIVAGNFDEKEMLEKITTLYQELNFTSYKVEVVKPQEPKEVNKKESTLYFPTARPIYELTFKVPVHHMSVEQKMKLDWYLPIFLDMNFGILSPIRQKLKNEKIIDQAIQNYFSIFEDYWLIQIGSYTDQKEVFKKEILNVLETPVVDKEVYDLSMKESKMHVSLRPEKLKKIVKPFMENLVIFNYPYLDDVEYLDTFSFEEYLNMINQLDFSSFIETGVIDTEK